MHNQYYVSHYPRYYYRNKYNDNDQHRIRGFNENGAKPFYRDQQEDRNRSQQTDRNRGQQVTPNRGNEAQNNNRPATNGRFVMRPETPRPVATRPPQKVGYYGKEIGHPVKVQRHMRENAPRANAPRSGNTSREGGNRGRGR